MHFCFRYSDEQQADFKNFTSCLKKIGYCHRRISGYVLFTQLDFSASR